MRKKQYQTCLLALLLAVLLLACGCVRTPDAAGPTDAVDAASASAQTLAAVAAGPAAAADTTPAADFAGQDGDIITLLCQNQNRLSAYNDQGYYYLSTEQYLRDGINLKYVDFATRQQRFLCAMPGCTHDTADCTSYFRTQYGACEIFLAYDHLFFINFSGAEQNVIQMCDLDGGNRRTLLQCSETEGLDNTYYGADRSHIYFVMDIGVTVDGQTGYRKSLQALDIRTGGLREVYAMDSLDFCQGSCGQYFLLRRLDMDNEIMTEYAIDLQGQPTDALYLPGQWTFFEHFLYYTDGGIIYDFTFDPTCTIAAWDLHTGQSRVVVADFPAPNSWESWFGAPTGAYMPALSCPDLSDGTRVNDYYIINLETGDYTPTDLIFYEGERPKLVCAQADVGDYLLVRTGYREVPDWAQQLGWGGTQDPVFALISKADYWAGIPNYIPITDAQG